MAPAAPASPSLSSGDTAGYYASNRTSKFDTTNWIIDSGATHHMTNTYQFFSDIQQLNPLQQVTIANGSKLPATGIGRVQIRLSGGALLTLTDILYLADFNVCLLSVDVLNESRYDLTLNAESRSYQIRDSIAYRKEVWTFLGRRTSVSHTYYVCGKVEKQSEKYANAPSLVYSATTFPTPKDPEVDLEDVIDSDPKHLEPKASSRILAVPLSL